MGSITFLGNVSDQASPGETVTIDVTKPDGTHASVTALTDAQGIFNAAYEDVPGSYSAVASIAADAKFQGATSNTVTFAVALGARAIILSVQ